MKKAIIFLLVSLLLLSFIGCFGDKSSDKNKEDEGIKPNVAIEDLSYYDLGYSLKTKEDIDSLSSPIFNEKSVDSEGRRTLDVNGYCENKNEVYINYQFLSTTEEISKFESSTMNINSYVKVEGEKVLGSYQKALYNGIHTNIEYGQDVSYLIVKIDYIDKVYSLLPSYCAVSLEAKELYKNNRTNFDIKYGEGYKSQTYTGETLYVIYMFHWDANTQYGSEEIKDSIKTTYGEIFIGDKLLSYNDAVKSFKTKQGVEIETNITYQTSSDYQIDLTKEDLSNNGIKEIANRFKTNVTGKESIKKFRELYCGISDYNTIIK